MHAQLLAYAAVLAIAAKVIYTLYCQLASPLRDVPGPAAAPWTKLWYFRSIWRGDAHQENIGLHRRYATPGQFYAPIVRLGPNLYSISQPDKAVYGIASKMEKSSWYEGWKHPSPERWTMFPGRNITRHAETRRKFQSMYSMSSLLHYEPLVEQAQTVFQQRLVEIANKGVAVDMHHWLQCYAFDVIGHITFGRRFGFLDDGQDIENCMANLETTMIYSTLVGVYAWAHPYLYRILEKLPGSGAAARNFLVSIVRKRIAERQALRREDEKSDRSRVVEAGAARDFLDVAMDAAKDPEKGMTDYNVFMMGQSNIIAGSDTTAVSLSSVLSNLARSPDVLASLRGELDQATKQGRMTPDHIAFKESQNMPYLQACIKEGLRLWAATGLPLWRVVPKGGAQIMGRFFPEGSEVGINTWVAHYDQDVWGADAAQFRPERWIEAQDNPERLRVMDNQYMPFGLGSRTCIGRHISYLEMCKVVPMIVSNFDLELLDPAHAMKAENYWFVRPTNFRCVVKPRKV
ncbi:P450 monooxygenase [Lecanosticta acicola]|uniref:P450 monooxygenase n=1 Tax=Lecanosticta acicola TaxID=111012 RepID=A0AAI8Z6W1_9PEZI|nr:P450 monooxygenase [Lecanosticta acicola]